MKKLSAFRIFLTIPLIALVMPDVAFWILDSEKYKIPVWHFVTCSVLLLITIPTYFFKGNSIVPKKDMETDG